MNFIHDGRKLRILLIVNVDGVSCIFKIFNVLCVHFEKVRKFDHDVADLLILRIDVPFVHSFSQLEKETFQIILLF